MLNKIILKSFWQFWFSHPSFMLCQSNSWVFLLSCLLFIFPLPQSTIISLPPPLQCKLHQGFLYWVSVLVWQDSLAEPHLASLLKQSWAEWAFGNPTLTLFFLLHVPPYCTPFCIFYTLFLLTLPSRSPSISPLLSLPVCFVPRCKSFYFSLCILHFLPIPV